MIHVREATLDDTQAVSALFRSRIAAWQRMNPQGQVEDVPYDALTIYERWLHGGPWMSVETAALHLSHLVRGAGMPIVAEIDGAVQAYAEVYHGVEPEPFGEHLHLGQLAVHAGYRAEGLEDAMLDDLLERTRTSHCHRLTANCIASDQIAQELYTRHGLMPLTRIKRYTIPAKSGQGFYKSVEHLNANASQITDWFMPVGRLGSARQQWETLWPRTWNAIPEVRERRIHRLHFSASGQEALMCCQQQLYAPRNADLYLWSPKPLTPQLLTAVRDWTHREGYRTLVMAVTDETAKVLGAEAEPDGYSVDVYGADATDATTLHS
jgi:ribosomal protein S18 acetylase RimI-like enzyme